MLLPGNRTWYDSARGGINVQDDAERFELHFEGERFKDHRLPLSMLSDLEAYKELLVAFVQEVWEDRNGGKRLSRKQLAAIELDLSALEKGSLNAVMVPAWAEDGLCLPGMRTKMGEAFHAAKEKVYVLYRNASAGIFPETLSKRARDAVSGIGKSLPAEGHSVGIKDASNDNEVKVTPEIRQKIIDAVNVVPTKPRRGIGRVSGINERGSIEITSETDGRFTIDLPAEAIDEKLSNRIKRDIVYEVEARIGSKDQVAKAVGVYYAEVLTDSLREIMVTQSQAVSTLRGKSPWASEGGEPVTEAAVLSADEFVRARPTLMDKLRIFPTPYGGILFEGKQAGLNVFIEMSDDGSITACIDDGPEIQSGSVNRSVLEYIDNLNMDHLVISGRE